MKMDLSMLNFKKVCKTFYCLNLRRIVSVQAPIRRVCNLMVCIIILLRILKVE